MQICYLDSNCYSLDGVIHRGRPPDALSGYFVITLDENVYGYCVNHGVKVSWLSTYLGFSSSTLLYDIYIRYFNVPCSDNDMLSIVLRGLVFPSNTVHCFIIDNTFCWFCIKNSKVLILGNREFLQSQSIYSCGDFIRRLSYDIVSKGYNIGCMNWYLWGADLWKSIIKVHSLKDVLWHVDVLSGKGCKEVSGLLSPNIGDEDATAYSVVQGLKGMKIREDSIRGIILPKYFFKDYSSCSWYNRGNNKFEYGLILDCEGKSSGILSDGCRELGGILYCAYEDKMVSEYTFITDETLLEKTLLGVLSLYQRYAPIPRGGINTYIFGHSDKVMLESNINKFSHSAKTRLSSSLNFINSMKLVKKYLGDDFSMRGSLSNIATYFGVCTIRPKHNALSDARTLFNILSHIRKEGNL